MTFSQSNLNDLIIAFTGVVLLFWRVAQMERHHTLRVFALTAVLSCFLIYFFNAVVKPTPFDEVVNFANQVR